MRSLIIYILVVLGIGCSVQASEVFGTAKEYAGNELIFYRYNDRITFIKEEMFRLTIDSIGKFWVKFDLEEITYVFGEFGIYHAYFFVEPDKEYEIILPPFAEKEAKDIFNPFFMSEKVHIGIKNMKKTDLNYLIIDFDYYYSRYHDLKLLDIYSLGLKTGVDTFINEINKRYEYADDSYFKEYKKYRVAALKNLATQKQYEQALIFAYFTKDTILYDNPAYMDLFNNIYSNYFDKYLISKNGAYLFAVINYGHSITRLHKLLLQHFELKNKQFRELVILKGINDSFANKNLSWLPLLLTLDSLYISTDYQKHQTISQNIADNALSLAKGTIAPPFELPDSVGNIKKLTNYRGKYVYLNFANTTTYTSQNEFELIKNIYLRYKAYCVFITVLTDENRQKATKFMTDNKYEWEYLFTEINSDVINTYKVSTYPTYYFIDPNGTLLVSPAPSPIDNFETYLFNIIEGSGLKKP
ncbi:MAG: redoxin domain-containing protein [Bacteroidales bacterium]|nr:redoxin domain-containing protein [Bacteroidales bacterium]MDD4217200.1 redoxin domain-containing protein [Bacteroidales bacterium]MDY0141317.1 redoxin domain-containing protein [Bacteroidales bacterium]